MRALLDNLKSFDAAFKQAISRIINMLNDRNLCKLKKYKVKSAKEGTEH